MRFVGALLHALVFFVGHRLFKFLYTLKLAFLDDVHGLWDLAFIEHYLVFRELDFTHIIHESKYFAISHVFKDRVLFEEVNASTLHLLSDAP